MSPPRIVESVTCLGCGCGCDDLSVGVSEGRIVSVTPACPVSRAWFGDGSIPDAVTRSGKATSIGEALTDAAGVLAAAAGRALVYIGPDVSAQAQRTSLAIADLLGARVDTATSEPAAMGLLAAQRRGRTGATLGELRNRADVVLFWAVDPRTSYPRFISKYIDPPGTHLPQGRAGRRLIAVRLGNTGASAPGDITCSIDPIDEIAALSVMRATVLGTRPAGLSPALETVAEAAEVLKQARYAVIVSEAEPSSEARSAMRAEGLIALTQSLNYITRAALFALRAGGNRTGAEAVLTWQTGYPISVDFGSGIPRYDPGVRALEQVDEVSAVLVVGAAAELTGETAEALGRVSTVVIGPRASSAPFRSRVAVDTGIAGIHEGGIGYRMDEVPLPLRPPLPGARSTTDTLESLLQAVRPLLPGRRA